jgi:hypothetical protein
LDAAWRHGSLRDQEMYYRKKRETWLGLRGLTGFFKKRAEQETKDGLQAELATAEIVKVFERRAKEVDPAFLLHVANLG